MPANNVTSNTPWHLILILDDSGSMAGAPASHVNQAVTAMVDEMKVLSMGLKPYFRLSVIIFGSHPRIVCEVSSEQQADMSVMATLAGDSGSTDAAAALSAAHDVLKRNPGKSSDFVPYVFFLSDGAPDDASTALVAGATLKKLQVAAGMPRLVTIGFGAVNDDFMRDLASTPELYKKLNDYRDIVRLFPNIGTIAQTAVGTKAVEQAIINL